MGSSPRAVSNQRKGSRCPARPLNQPRGLEPGTSSFRGGRFEARSTLGTTVNRQSSQLPESSKCSIPTLFTPHGLSDPRVTASQKSALTNFLAKPDKSYEELNLIQNLRPIALRVVVFKIFTVLLKCRFTSSLELTGTIDEE